MLLACALRRHLVGQLERVPFSEFFKISSSVMIFVMLVGLRCSDAFSRTEQFRSVLSIKEQTAKPAQGPLSSPVLSPPSLLFLFRCFVLLLVGRFSILLCRSHFQRALQEAPGSSAGSRRYFVFFSSYSPETSALSSLQAMQTTAELCCLFRLQQRCQKLQAHRGVHGLQNFSFRQ